MAQTPTLTELDILSDVISPKRADLTPDVARTVLRWKFSKKSIARMDRLAAKNRQGKITARERELLDQFLRVGSLVNLLQAKAHKSLGQNRAS